MSHLPTLAFINSNQENISEMREDQHQRLIATKLSNSRNSKFQGIESASFRGYQTTGRRDGFHMQVRHGVTGGVVRYNLIAHAPI